MWHAAHFCAYWACPRVACASLNAVLRGFSSCSCGRKRAAISRRSRYGKIRTQRKGVQAAMAGTPGKNRNVLLSVERVGNRASEPGNELRLPELFPFVRAKGHKVAIDRRGKHKVSGSRHRASIDVRKTPGFLLRGRIPSQEKRPFRPVCRRRRKFLLAHRYHRIQTEAPLDNSRTGYEMRDIFLIKRWCWPREDTQDPCRG